MVEQKEIIDHPLRVKVINNPYDRLTGVEAELLVSGMVGRIAPVSLVSEQADCVVIIDPVPRQLSNLMGDSPCLIVVAAQKRKEHSLNTYLRECRVFTREFKSCKVKIISVDRGKEELEVSWWPLCRELFNFSSDYDYDK